MQAMIEGWSLQEQRVRAAYQMTLGELINNLELLPADSMVEGLINPHSYRGHYIDLAFEPPTEQHTAAQVIKTCRSVMGEVLEGYKGGEFQMGRNTPIWIAHTGELGHKIMALKPDGTFCLEADES